MPGLEVLPINILCSKAESEANGASGLTGGNAKHTQRMPRRTVGGTDKAHYRRKPLFRRRISKSLGKIETCRFQNIKKASEKINERA